MIGDLSTERLRLRPMTRDDVGHLVELNSDAEVMRFITGRPSTEAEVQEELDGSLGTRWLVFDDTGGEFLGWVAAFPDATASVHEIGWRFVRRAWGRGVAHEAASALVDAVFESGAERVFAQTMAVNERSRALMTRLGMTYARTFHLEFDDPLPGTELGEVEYALTRQEWESARQR